jgi:hypothetical protein
MIRVKSVSMFRGEIKKGNAIKTRISNLVRTTRFWNNLKGVIISCTLKKNRQHNDEKKKKKKTNNNGRQKVEQQESL